MIITLAALQSIRPNYTRQPSWTRQILAQADTHHPAAYFTGAFFNLIMNIIGSFQVFTQAFVMTASSSEGSEGGPNNATLFFVLYLYKKAFQQFKMGYASALAWILFLIILVFTAVQFGLSVAGVL